MAGLVAARRRGRKGGRPPALDPEKIEQIIAALDSGASKASVCRTFKVPRSTLIDTLNRAGWIGTGAGDRKPERPTAKKVASLKRSCKRGKSPGRLYKIGIRRAPYSGGDGGFLPFRAGARGYAAPACPAFCPSYEVFW